MRSLFLIAAVGLAMCSAALAEPSPEAKAALDHSIRQLRESHGTWSVTTRFLKPGGSVAKGHDTRLSTRAVRRTV